MNIEDEIEAQRLEDLLEGAVGRIAEVLGEEILELDYDRRRRLLVDTVNTVLAQAQHMNTHLQTFCSSRKDRGGEFGQLLRDATYGCLRREEVEFQMACSQAYSKGNYEAAYTGTFAPGNDTPELLVHYTLGYYSTYELNEIEDLDHRALVRRHRKTCYQCGASVD